MFALAADLRSAKRRVWLFAALGGGAAFAQETHQVPLFPAAADANHEGFVRVINHSREAGQVEIAGFDAGGRKAGPITLAVGAGQAVHFNSGDFERGNPAKGIPEGAGAPTEGDWRLALTATLDLEVNAYIRTSDGFLTSVVDVAPQAAGAHRIGFFNPGGNTQQRSRLRVVNTSDRAAAVRVYGVDDHGEEKGPLRFRVPARGAYGLDAVALEAGLGDGRSGQGKWRLTVRAAAPLLAMSLLESPTGHLSNLSAGAIRARRQDGERLLRVPFFPAAGAVNEGFVRVANPGVAGVVRITAVDDAGNAKPAVALAVGAGRTVHFNSKDLAQGNPDKGLPRGVGAGVGDWRLELRTALPTLEVSAYLRTPDGFVTAMHDVVAPDADVAFFNPGDNRRQRSLLRLVNHGAVPATVRLTGVDDAGERGGEVVAAVPARGATTVDASALESGEELLAGGEGLLAGALGDGVGKWRLAIAANQPITAMSLLDSPTGPLTNLSATSRKTAAELFRAEVAAPVVAERCVGCHAAGGAAAATRLVFSPATEADHAERVERNWQALTRFFRVATDAKALLADKPRGRAGHGGGVSLQADSTAHASWVRLLGRMDAQFAWLRAPAALVDLVDAIPAAGREVDPGAGQVDVVHLGTPGAAYRYPPPCPRGVAVRRSLEAAAGDRRELVDHKLECELPARNSETVRVRGTGSDGEEIEAALPLNTSDERGAAQMTVRDRRALSSAEVNELFDRYIEDILVRTLDSDVNRLLLAVVVDQIARRTWAELRDPDARYPVVTESVSYASRNPRGERSDAATGLVARPEIGDQANFTRKPRVVVLAHATGATPSALSFADAWYAFAAMLAGRGYLVVAADNWGRGDLAPAGQPETYLLTNRTANNGVDLLRAVLAAPEYRAFHNPEAEADVSIIGYSQGGHTAVALWLALHTADHGARVRELHSGAGPHNLRETFLGVLRQVAGECDGDDGDEWCRHVNRDIVIQYMVGRVLPALFAYTAPGLSSEEVLDGTKLRPEFVTGMLRGEARYDTLSALLALNSHTNIIAPERVVRAGTEIHLYHAKDDRLVPEANTRELNALLKPRFDVTYHDDECDSTIHRILTDVVDRVGALHAVCGIEVLDDILKRFP